MEIETVHGLQATGMTLDQRFTMLASAAPDRVIKQKKQTVGSFLNQSLNFRNRNLIQEIARQLEYQAQKQALRNRIRMREQPGLRRFGSESSLVGLRRANSFGNLTQQNVKSRLSWRQTNGHFRNRSRSVSVSSAPGGRGAGPRRRARGAQQRSLRGRFWNFRDRLQFGQFKRITRVQRRGARRGGARGRGSARGGNRGGVARAQTPKKVPTREELDAQLDQYMAGTKAALDKELDDYMKDAMDLE